MYNGTVIQTKYILSQCVRVQCQKTWLLFCTNMFSRLPSVHGWINATSKLHLAWKREKDKERNEISHWNIREKNVHFNIDSGHFEFMSGANYADYQTHFISPKLDFLRHLPEELSKPATWISNVNRTHSQLLIVERKSSRVLHKTFQFIFVIRFNVIRCYTYILDMSWVI